MAPAVSSVPFKRTLLPRRRFLRLLAGLGAGVGAVAAGLCADGPRPSLADEAREPGDGRLFHGGGLFIWHEEALHTEGKREVLDLMVELGLTEAYLYVPEDTRTGRVGKVLASAERRGIDVYLLAGSASWGLDPSGEQLIEQVRRAARYEGVRGLVADVEPHLLDGWDTDRVALLQTYAQAMARAREAAQVGIEAQLCARHGRPLTVIYELQPAGVHGLQDYNTYHDDGLEAVAASYEALAGRFPDVAVSCALHDGKTLIRLARPDA